MYLLFIGIIISIIFCLLILPRKEGFKPKINPTFYPILYDGMIIIPIDDNKAIHLHHWVIYLIIFLLSFVIYIPQIIIGYSIGLIINGISYKDRFEFICENPY